MRVFELCERERNVWEEEVGAVEYKIKIKKKKNRVSF